jgi:hypothetical protein
MELHPELTRHVMSDGYGIAVIRTVFPHETKPMERHDTSRRRVGPRPVGRTEMRQFIEETLDDCERAVCEFRFCPGPDKPTVHMATCFMCRRVKRLRVMLAWLTDGFPEENDREH